MLLWYYCYLTLFKGGWFTQLILVGFGGFGVLFSCIYVCINVCLSDTYFIIIDKFAIKTVWYKTIEQGLKKPSIEKNSLK